MKKSDFYFDLPPELIAQTPLEPRDSSRLLHYAKESGQISDRHFSDLPSLLNKGDVLVMNNTKVLPARLMGKKTSEGGARAEFLLLKRLNLDHWKVLVKPGKRLRIGSKVDFGLGLSAEIIEEADMGERVVKFLFDGVFEDVLHKIGEMPLPHYIHEKLKEPSRYQTVYAKTEGSAAAPTAGLHFTDRLIDEIKAKGVEVAEVLLHVGLGTFRPVKSDDIKDHVMHSEYYEISESAAQTVNNAVREGRRVIAVGTTCVRVLESVAGNDGFIRACAGETNIFIYPPYKFKTVKGIITNFHLPESTLLMLISAFLGKEVALNLYDYAIKSRYRFFSFGDSMILI